MPIISIVMGALLVGLGAWGYAAADTKSVTALIPAFVGGPLILCGLVALKDTLLKHVMRAAAVIGLLGFLASAGRLGMVAVKDGLDLTKLSQQSMAGMAGLCAVFVGLCINAFIQARRRRQTT